MMDRNAASRPPAVSYLLPLLLLGVAAAYVIMAQGFGVASRTVPRLVGVVTAVLCVLDAVSRTETSAGRAVTSWLNPAGAGDIAVMHRHRQGLALAGVAALVAAMVTIGILPAVASFGLLALRFRAGRGWATSLAAGAAIAGVIWALFGLVLGLHLFPGLLFGGGW